MWGTVKWPPFAGAKCRAVFLSHQKFARQITRVCRVRTGLLLQFFGNLWVSLDRKNYRAFRIVGFISWIKRENAQDIMWNVMTRNEKEWPPTSEWEIKGLNRVLWLIRLPVCSSFYIPWTEYISRRKLEASRLTRCFSYFECLVIIEPFYLWHVTMVPAGDVAGLLCGVDPIQPLCA